MTDKSAIPTRTKIVIWGYDPYLLQQITIIASINLDIFLMLIFQNYRVFLGKWFVPRKLRGGCLFDVFIDSRVRRKLHGPCDMSISYILCLYCLYCCLYDMGIIRKFISIYRRMFNEIPLFRILFHQYSL